MIRQTKKTRAALAAGAVGLGLVLSACSPITTNKPYGASDGIRATVGDIVFENLLVVSAAEGEPGRVLGGVTNTSEDDALVTLATEDGSVAIPVALASGATLNFYVDQDEVPLIPSVSAAPGSMVTLTATVGGGETTTLSVPVLDGTLDEYADSVPGPLDLVEIEVAG